MKLLNRSPEFLRSTRKHMFLALVFLFAAGSVIPASAVGNVAADTPKSLDRSMEAVTVMDIFGSAPINELCVYRRTAGNWEVIPFQIDEKDNGGNYVGNEDGVFDSNDEIIFLAGDTGDLSDSLISDALSVGTEWYRIEVTNPLSPTAKGWAYIVRSTAVNCTNATDYASFDAGTNRVNAKDYAVGWASTHNGLDFTSLFGGPDILDRSKLRIQRTFTTITEDLIPVQNLELIKDGPVRVIVRRAGAETLAYGSYSFTRTPVDLSVILGTIVQIRISTDLAASVTGTYYDENSGAGVNIDGLADNVPATPMNQAWRQVSLDSGTMVQFADFSSVGGTLQHYYQDQANCGGSDTGDGQCWGDSGFSVLNPPKQAVVVTSGQFALPGKQPNVGATYFNYSQNPLTVTATKQTSANFSVFIPLVERQ